VVIRLPGRLNVGRLGSIRPNSSGVGAVGLILLMVLVVAVAHLRAYLRNSQLRRGVSRNVDRAKRMGPTWQVDGDRGRHDRGVLGVVRLARVGPIRRVAPNICDCRGFAVSKPLEHGEPKGRARLRIHQTRIVPFAIAIGTAALLLDQRRAGNGPMQPDQRFPVPFVHAASSGSQGALL
jgi:hypothetical protein